MKPNFSGTWRFNRARSRLEIPPPDDSTFQVRHREPHFALTRTHVVQGKADTLTIDLVTDGAEATHAIRDFALRARLFWDGDDLVFDSILKRGEQRAHNVVRYRLSDPDTLVADERFRSENLSYDNVWWLDRLTQSIPHASDGAARR